MAPPARVNEVVQTTFSSLVFVSERGVGFEFRAKSRLSGLDLS